MGRKNKFRAPPFVMLENGMLDSEEWQGISSNAVRVYILLRRKFKGHNADDLSLTYREVQHNMSPATYSKVLKELKEKEIISVVRQGGLYNRCTIFSIRNKWFIQGGKAPKDPVLQL